MKKIFLIVLVLISVKSFSQTATPGSDEFTRTVQATYYIQEATDLNYTTAAGEAVHNLVLASFRSSLTIVTLNTDKLSSSDNAKIQSLVAKLTYAKQNPPTWEELSRLEETRLIQVDKNVRKTSKYH